MSCLTKRGEQSSVKCVKFCMQGAFARYYWVLLQWRSCRPLLRPNQFSSILTILYWATDFTFCMQGSFMSVVETPKFKKPQRFRVQIYLMSLRLEADQLLRKYRVYRLHIWHARVFHEGRWAPWVSKTTEVRGQS